MGLPVVFLSVEGGQADADLPGEPGESFAAQAARLARRLAAREVAPTDTAAALEAARDVAELDVDAPTGGGRMPAQVKQAVKRLTSWYLAYLAQQANDLAFALLRVSETLDARADQAEHRWQRSQEQLDGLEARVRALEAALGAANDTQTKP